MSIPKFFQVGPHVFRGGQPDVTGLRVLKQIGIRTVISLRDPRDVLTEPHDVEVLSMAYISVPLKDSNIFNAWGRKIPPETVRYLLALLDFPERTFIHCKHGRDRTGVIIGLYRVQQGWTADEAIKEAEQFGMRAWYTGYRQQIKDAAAAV
jgi:protein tyrosine/serine phosphatase